MINEPQIEFEKIQTESKQIAEYKEKYKAVKKIVSFDGEHVLWLRKPNRMVVGAFMAKYEENRVEACEYVLNDACIQEISDYKYFINDEEAFYGIMSELISLISLKKNISTSF